MCGEAKELIQLYLDNEMDARGALDVQRHLETCSACSRLLGALMEQDQLLKQTARAEVVNSSAVRANILGSIRNQSAKAGNRWIVLPLWRRVAAAAAIITVGLLLVGRGLLPGANQNVYAAVASDHADHCSIDSVMGAITDSDELARLSAAYGKMNTLPNLKAYEYGNPRGRICKVNGVEFFHLVYYNPQEPPLSLFMRPHSANLIADQLTISQSAGYRVASISQSGVDLMLVSSLDDKQTTVIVQAIASQL